MTAALIFSRSNDSIYGELFAFADETKKGAVTIDSIKLGKDYTDLTASIKVCPQN